MSGAYFHRGISRLRAEELLLSAKEDGSFLVRDSETLTGAYVLCLLYQTRVHQYRVLPGHDGKLSVQAEGGAPEPRYADLNSLVADYIKKEDKNGLAYALKHPVPPERSDDADSDEEDYPDVQQIELPSVTTPSQPSPPAPTVNNCDNCAEDSSQQKIQLALLKNFSKLNLSSYEREFVDAVKLYLDKGIESDVTAVKVGESNLPEFQGLLETAASKLQSELDQFSTKLRILNELLTIPEANSGRFGSSFKNKNNGPGIPSMLEKMSSCRTDIVSLENKVQETLRYFSVSQYDYVPATGDTEDSEMPKSFIPLLSSIGKPHIPRSDFEVKLLRHGSFHSKMTLSVDISQGKLFAVKPSKDALDPSSVFTHDRILQLVKNTKDNMRLDLVLSGKKKYTVTFEGVHKRENFCQQIMQMKNMHSTQMDVDQISVFIGTWNMGDSQPTASINSWLKCNGNGKARDPQVLGVIPHDLYVIGTQESAMTEKDWVNFVKNHIKSCLMADMEVVEVCTLWGIRLIILVKNMLRQHINRIQRSTVRTGIANALGNKGAVAISFYFKGTSFCFINSHLTSGDERNERRNQNYRDIIKGLSLGQKHLGLFDVTNQFNHIFWLGDLNYRIEDEIGHILERLDSKDIQSLLPKDQLRKSQHEKKGFCGFSEADITFMPTYRLPRCSMEWKYDWRKIKRTGERINAPSWCDRVLWRSYPGTYIENIAYGCADKVLGSDHRPVFASFNIGITSDFVMNRDSLVDEANVRIVFQTVDAQVKTCCKQYFQLEFHSTCLPEVGQSKPNNKFVEHKTGFYTCPTWEKKQLPELQPLFGDQDYLEEQHILIAVRSRDGDNECYGECVVEMKNKFDLMPQEFTCQLLHQGEVTGKLSGQFHILTGNQVAMQVKNPRHSKKSYELVALDTEYIDPELWHPDSPNFEGRQDLRSQVFPHQYENQDGGSHPSLNHVQSVPLIQSSERPQQPLPRFTSDDMPACSIEVFNPLFLSAKGKTGNDTMGGGRAKSQPYMGQASLQAPRQVLPVITMPTTPNTTPPDLPPPPVPRKGPSYVNVNRSQPDSEPPRRSKRPSSVINWLQDLGLFKYNDNFTKNGFLSMGSVVQMNRNDLVHIGVENIIHRDIILESLKSLKP
ncbi:hypothetical protein FSP39_004619 [Pinctada imbricata]|uniref:phosphatidylinositol-3,4,5-trisphosphate 5-phosphatase n=1 Tax=Pinctada imbricata TaxID=66713 RepID=A0AA88Y962_PINIB|nr:hypothetical protein FSP39_004619 [Pinctada imbricata]